MKQALTISFLFCAAFVSFAAFQACIDCIDSGHNKKVPDAGYDEYQLVIDNGISREMPVFVDDEQVATVCGDSKGVVVGNFKVSSCSTFKVRNEAQSCTAQLTPCGGYLCYETCSTNCFNTNYYAGEQIEFNLCFEEQCM